LAPKSSLHRGIVYRTVTKRERSLEHSTRMNLIHAHASLRLIYRCGTRKQTAMNNSFPNDIADEDSIKHLVDTFYGKVRADDLIGPVFESAIQDWNEHLPTMYAFWSNLLFRKGGYTGNPWLKHAPLDIERKHFQRWLELFNQTVSELFEGPMTEQAIGAAQSIAHSFQVRKGINPFSDSGT